MTATSLCVRMRRGHDVDGRVVNGEGTGCDAAPEIELLVDILEVGDGDCRAVGAGHFQADPAQTDAMRIARAGKPRRGWGGWCCADGNTNWRSYFLIVVIL